MICINCLKEYDVEEVRKVFGSVWWIGKCCSAECYTETFRAKTEMEIKCVNATANSNDAKLNFTRENGTTARIWHYNKNDSFFEYEFVMTGPPSDLDKIEEFCNKLEQADLVSEKENG